MTELEYVDYRMAMFQVIREYCRDIASTHSGEHPDILAMNILSNYSLVCREAAHKAIKQAAKTGECSQEEFSAL